jgi:hypothetical protein
VRWLVLARVGRMTLTGGIVRAGLALGLGRLAQAMLFGVEGNSAAIIGAAALSWSSSRWPRARSRRAARRQ